MRKLIWCIPILVPALLALAAGAARAQDDPNRQPRVIIRADGDAEVRVEVQVDAGNGVPRVIRKVVKTGAEDAADKPADDANAPDADRKPPVLPTVMVRLMGISVLKPTPEQAEQLERQQHWWSHGPGTTLTFEASVDKGSLVALIDSKCRLISFNDDLGTRLVATKKVGLLDRIRGVEPPMGRWIERWNQGRPDGTCNFKIGGVRCPVDGAMVVMLDAEVTLLWAAREKTVKAKNVELKDGVKVDLGMAKMEVKDLPAQWGGNMSGFGLQYEGEQSMQNRIKGWRFFKPDGTEIGQRGGGSSSSVENGRQTMTQYFYMPEKFKKLTIELIYWDETQELKVPVNVSKGVGF